MVSVLVAVFSVFAFSVWAKLYWHQEFEIIFNARTCSVSTFPKCIFRLTLHNIYTKAIVDVKICLILRDKNDFSCLDIVVMVCVCMCVCMRARVCELRYYCQPLSSIPASWRLSQMFEWSITMKNSHIAAPFFVHECWNYFSDTLHKCDSVFFKDLCQNYVSCRWAYDFAIFRAFFFRELKSRIKACNISLAGDNLSL